VADDDTRASDPPKPKKPPSLDDTVPASSPPDGSIDDLPLPAAERYRLGAELGRGGMGRVVEAFDTQLGRAVAFKEVLPSGGAAVARRFRREVQITARLEHASIVPLYDAGTTSDGRPFYVMRRVTGRPLDQLVARASDLSERLALLPNVLAAIDAVAHAHRRGVLHRDLKPANILVGELGETVVIDWGLAKVIGEPDDDDPELRAPAAADSLLTQVGSVFGTPGFMAPEQARGEELGPRGDVFALGATLYQLLVGRPPLVGNSATEAIESTLTNKIVPVATACPAAPPELVAIVDKALAFEADARYPDAGALGEDVRRFLTGQLVAAHRYTRRQRVARFARRHRAPLSVAALATVAVAVLAWISVHRIVVARDDADDARQLAETGQRDAEQARDRLARQYDALLIEKARDRVDKNPTEAIAVLKQLRAGSPKLDDARAIAKAAVMRGVAYAMQAPVAMPMYAELSGDASEVAVASYDGSTSVWNLDSHRMVFTQNYGRDARARWITGNRMLVCKPHHSPFVVDPVTGHETPVVADPWVDFTPSDDGEHVMFRDDHQHVGVRVLATGNTRILPTTSPPEDLEISPDGAFAAVIDHGGVTVFDRSANVIARRDGAIAFARFSHAHRIAVLDNTMPQHVLELALDAAKPEWVEVPVAVKPSDRIVHAFYRGDDLQIVQPGSVSAWRDGKPAGVRSISYNAPAIDDAGDGVLVLPGTNGTLHYDAAWASGEIPLPAVLPHMRLAGRHGASRLVVTGEGSILIYDLDDFVPKHVPQWLPSAAAWIDDDTLAILTPQEGWQLHDLRTAKRTQVGINASMLTANQIETGEGRMLLTTHGDTTRIVLLPASSPHPRLVAAGDGVLARLLPGNAIVVVFDDHTVSGAIGDAPPHELARLDGRITSLTVLGIRSFAAISARGDLVRGTVDGPVEHVHVDVKEPPMVGGDRAGNVLIASGARMLAWDTVVHPLAEFRAPILSFQPAIGGVVVQFANRETEFLALAPGAKPQPLIPQMMAQPTVSPDGRMLIAVGLGGQIHIVDFPSLSRWTLPVRYEATVNIIDPSPNGRILQGEPNAIALWTLPQPGASFPTWLDELTNATEDVGDVLVWPWQVTGRATGP
jgi:hypothetical protein